MALNFSPQNSITKQEIASYLLTRSIDREQALLAMRWEQNLHKLSKLVDDIECSSLNLSHKAYWNITCNNRMISVCTGLQ